MGTEFSIYRCRSCKTLPGFNGLCCKLAKIALFIYLIQYWVECKTSSVVSSAYFADLFKLNISGNNADICKPQTAF